MNNKTQLKQFSSTTLHIIIWIALVLGISACSLPDMKRQLDQIDSLSTITGNIQVNFFSENPIKVLLFRDNGNNAVSLVNQFLLNDDGRYTFYVPKGRYLVAAYISSREDGVYTNGDHAVYYGLDEGNPGFLSVGEQRIYESGTLIFNESLRAKGGGFSGETRIGKMNDNIGKIISLDDPIFSEEYANMGLWYPLDFIERIGGGLYQLNDHYEPEKIPVFFVHGINGSANNWTKVINGLDTQHFQPYVLHYASGARLDMISNYLVKATNTLYSKYKFKQFYVVAHSMGGLVSRSFLKKHSESLHPAKIGLFMTINSPLIGMDSANMGLKYSPILIPSWRDVASGSDFIKDINDWRIPNNTPYHLVFSYESGKGNDGVVPLESQIPAQQQLEAVRLYGFNTSHSGILNQSEFITLFNQVLTNTLSE